MVPARLPIRLRCPLDLPHDRKSALEAGCHQIVLVVVVVVEGTLCDVEPRGDLLDRGAAIALLVDEHRGRAQEGFRRDLLRRGPSHLRQNMGAPDGFRRGQAVEENVADPVGHASVILRLVMIDPVADAVHHRNQQVGPGVPLGPGQERRARPVEDAAQMAEHLVIGAEHQLHMGRGERPHVAEAHEGRPLAGGALRKRLAIKAQDRPQALFRRVFPQGGGNQPFQNFGGAQEARRRELLLLAIVIGDAVGDQPDALGDVGQGRSLQALLVEQAHSRIENGLPLLFVAFGLARKGVDGRLHSSLEAPGRKGEPSGRPHFSSYHEFVPSATPETRQLSVPVILRPTGCVKSAGGKPPKPASRIR
jgi:hypothetical protein